MPDEKPEQKETEKPEPQPSEAVEVAEPVEQGQPDDQSDVAANSAGEPAADQAKEDDALAEMTQEELEEARANEVAFSWQASEFVHHHKGPGWYAVLFGGVAALVAVAVWLKLWLEIAAFLVMGTAIMVYARKPPRTLTYELTPKGITIEGKLYLYSEFRSFGVLKDDEWHTIDLEPVKRLSPRITVLFDTDDFDSIVGHLELHLPRTDREPDAIERLSRYLRF